MKKILIGLIVLIVLLCGGGYYWYSTRTVETVSNPIDAIPTSAVLVINYPNITAVWNTFEELDYYESVFSIEELGRFYARNLLLDSLMRYDPNLKKSLEGAAVWSSYHINGKDSVGVFHAIETSGKNQLNLLTNLQNACRSAGIVSNVDLNGLQGFKLVVKEPFYTLYVTLKNGLILAASNPQLLKEANYQLASGKSLLDDKSFQKAVNAAGKNVEANFYINYKAIPQYLTAILKPTLLEQQERISEFASWTELDVTLKNEGLACNGFTYSADSLNQFLGLFLNQTPQSIDFPDHIPANTASFLFYGISDVISFVADYRSFYAARGELVAMEEKLDSLNQVYETDLEHAFLGWMGKTYGLCITEPTSASFANQSYWIFETRSEELASKLLSDLATKLAAKSELTVEKSQVNGVEIGQLKLEGVVSELFGDGYEAFENPYYLVYNKYVVFASSQSSLESYLQYVQADRTLAKDLSFSRFAESLSSSFNVFSYHHLKRSKQIFNSYLNNDAVEVLQNNASVVSQFEALGTQISSTGSSFYSNVFLKYNPNAEEVSEDYWKAEMDAPIQTNPVFVKNHLSGEQEVLVQDKNNQLYLFNLVGQQLFKRELPETIESRPVQIDAFNNKKLQYIFNTKNYIYLIDRNGKDVDGFPIELNSPAETELSVIEYDNKRDYRLLISCKNKRIYNYNVEGKKVSGWRHNRAPNPTVQPFKHLVVRGKDYIITGEDNGKVHLLDRRGKNRVKVEKYVKPSKNNELQPYRSSETALAGVYITNDEGLIHRIGLDGEVQSMDLGKFSPEHHFLVKDLDGDGGPEFIFYDLNMLQVFSYKKEKVFEQRIDPSATNPKLIELSDNSFGIGFCYEDSEQLVLFNASGEMVQGFPLSGNSQFDMVVLPDGNTQVVSAGVENTLLIQELK